MEWADQTRLACKAGWKRASTFQSSCAEKKSIITLCSGFCVEMLWADKHGPLGGGGQTETDLLYLLKQRHKWKVDLRSPEIIKTSPRCPSFYWQDSKEHIRNICTFMSFYLELRACFYSVFAQIALFNGKLFRVCSSNLIWHTISV